MAKPVGGGLDFDFWKKFMEPVRTRRSVLFERDIANYKVPNNQLNESLLINGRHKLELPQNPRLEKFYINSFNKNDNLPNDINMNAYFVKYGFFWTCLLFGFRCLNLIALPLMIFHFCGLVFYPAFPDPPHLHLKQQFSTHVSKSNEIINSIGNYGATSNISHPFICFRVVTRGNFPSLVRKNVKRNLETCQNLGIGHYIIQVVTDQSIGLLNQNERKVGDRIFELVVPDSYRTPRGSLFKARALQFALEDVNHFLNDDDWIVHLDEETLLTTDSLIGILNFICDGKNDFGQGLITYSRDGVVNWLTTLADTFRVADDMGKNRFQLKFFSKPLFNWKGSFVVTRAAAERCVTFDVGPHGSIAEDCYFAMTAIRLQSTSAEHRRHLISKTGVSADRTDRTLNFWFDFVDGEMWEKSPFTVGDFLKQRKRWLQGIYLVVHKCPEIPIWSSKLCLALFVYAWILMPVILLNEVLINQLWPLKVPRLLRVLTAFISGTTVYMYAFGAITSFCCAGPTVPTNASAMTLSDRDRVFSNIDCPEKIVLPNYTKSIPNGQFDASVFCPSGSKTDSVISNNLNFMKYAPNHSNYDSDYRPNLHDLESRPNLVQTELKESRSNNLVRRFITLFRRRSTILNIFLRCIRGQTIPKRAFKRRSLLFMNISGDSSGSHSIRHSIYQFAFFAFCVIGSIAVIPFNVVIEVIAVIWGLIGKKHQFYIVSKQIES
ncbi:unnamed protein product [Gordionus sp. m RMFG-2023]|uniref:beta-1,4-mannosyltransferase egh-like isoform X3 n=1 Tax=Gordionus sp. m RMFG-2023 TaxID=3053472 RepID=UPI0030E2958D